MTSEQFQMQMLIGGWLKKDYDSMHCDEAYTHPDSPIAIGIPESSNADVVIFMDDKYVGPADYAHAINTINFHMQLLADLQNG
jgi:hypothetical protein